MNQSYLSLGSNMGDRFEMLRQAVLQLSTFPSITVTRISSLYETDPVGYKEQEPFLNMVVQLETELNAVKLLDVCQKIEQNLNRKRLIRWGPRTIDLDILLYNQDNIKNDRLIVPHPRMDERAFVIVPLLEINQEFKVEDNFEVDGVRLWKSYKDIEMFLQDVRMEL
ncbi:MULTISPECIES: 2-amino-4-hydroxy-6-hydroxymethyldihydropteridine diphosphokinase [Planococcus]|uniref:2-amino-4-hydroxy-6-hydroxymethyldihydropteridine diphosphokinase n=2 Tax=Planococcus TaxID=1372 RepID=A0ABN4K298_9BACL|nr:MULTISPECIES: 2-amino-4-hydroxy-6-hydroxymethyldihydropteridine diphosphokinase [Planococcus]ALS80141.1 2-amino-4-hydroxy-6-hydroxymethyldihydropteridine pyrophosphokinase [Planococcus kocurii]AQU77869.1 2-amino-4-hydroxy-6-hydroxymethyldihydropteridine diphosphokinase [Planococcus faecalis]KAA0954806.1 2-amino-4-hydroxy-6-hydroxymethyldihydropteridine diphosphokinase [Planococcus sp. ANT_H30]MDJ0333266.1 2-amino-4-hydroxy-6-hydroxymethyldihydropteridine diphosphokinase [Planococcus sp. S3-L